jgi:hypothetical protein
VAVPYQVVFLGLLLVYLLVSFLRRWNPVYPLYGGLVLLLAAGAAEALSDPNAANNLALDVVFALGGGVALIALDRLRRRTRDLAPEAPATQPAQGRELVADHALDHLEGEAVPVVHAAGGEDDEDVHTADGEAEHSEDQPGGMVR